MRAKSLEELRAGNRARQARWREKHLGYVRLRERNAKRVARSKDNVREAPVPNKRENVPNVIPHYGEIHYGPVEGYDVMEPEQKGGWPKQEVKKEEPGAREVVKTEVEKKVEADLERLLAKREGEWAL